MEEPSLFEEDEVNPPPSDTYPDPLLRSDDDSFQLVAVEIDGLKGFDSVEVELQPMTVLTGPNNSGKSTVLQAIALAFEVLRRCIDTERWTLRSTGRALVNFEFLPVNEPRDLWFQQIWKPSKQGERYIRVGLRFSNGFKCVARIRFLFGGLNVGIEPVVPKPDEHMLKALFKSIPVLLPATPGPDTHETYTTPAQVHRLLNIREPSRVLRNVLLRLQEPENEEARNFVASVLYRYFDTILEEISFDELRDFEIRAPIREGNYSLDVVSAGSGLNQILQLAAIIVWRNPGIVLLDEPDAHLHPSVQAQLLDFLTSLVERFQVQVILATHSRDLISQAPLQSIVPVDRSRSKLGPLESLDHLLLEYQRQGTITNIDLALLYQTKRCIFVEGRTDSQLLPLIAQRLGSSLFVGREQVVLFEFEGVDKIKFLPELVNLFERVIGAQLRWGVIRDSDANVPEVKDKHEALAKELNIPAFYQWKRYSIENYLLEPGLLAAASNRKKQGIDIDVDQVKEILDEAIVKVEDSVSGVFVTKTQTAYRNFGVVDDNPFDAGAVAATRYLRSITTLEKKLVAYPGKKIFGAFVEMLQEKFGVNIRLEEIVAEITPENAPTELKECLTRMQEV